jgi:hypothetical protein
MLTGMTTQNYCITSFTSGIPFNMNKSSLEVSKFGTAGIRAAASNLPRSPSDWKTFTYPDSVARTKGKNQSGEIQISCFCLDATGVSDLSSLLRIR